MTKIFELWVGNRYVRSRSSNSFVSLISAISMLGIAIAVAVLFAAYMGIAGLVERSADTGAFVPNFLAPGQSLVLVFWGAILGSVGAITGVWRVAQQRL